MAAPEIKKPPEGGWSIFLIHSRAAIGDRSILLPVPQGPMHPQVHGAFSFFVAETKSRPKAGWWSIVLYGRKKTARRRFVIAGVYVEHRA